MIKDIAKELDEFLDENNVLVFKHGKEIIYVGIWSDGTIQCLVDENNDDEDPVELNPIYKFSADGGGDFSWGMVDTRLKFFPKTSGKHKWAEDINKNGM